MAAFRRPRMPSTAAGSPANNMTKPRRTSLPTLSLQRPQNSGTISGQVSPSALDVALLAEAHGIVADMLADSSLQQHVVTGLRALSSLLCPPNHTVAPQRHRALPTIALSDLSSASDSEEIVGMGEKISALPKRFRRPLPSVMLRRLSTSTWTTTTSATGMPTLEPEPSRKRSASFRNSAEAPAGSPTNYAHYSLANQNLAPLSERLPAAKSRSYSTTSLLLATGTSYRRSLRERKTVCSLHPLTASDIHRLHSLSRAASSRDPSPPPSEENLLAAPTNATSPTADSSSPVLRRLFAAKADCDPPNGNDGNETPCTRLPESGERDSPVLTNVEKSDSVAGDGKEWAEDGLVMVEDGTTYNIGLLNTDPLWSLISEWDYPIFDVSNQSRGCILSQMCYRVFLQVGLFETFKIPLLEFLNYFRTLEAGYREKPYHNRTHAADVLHGVYYLTSQPIPGFPQLPPDTPPPDNNKGSSGTSGSGLVTRQSFNVEDTYGIMGANFPALELMALYVAAAMHDYDHPGRTNAFLVMTHAPQAVLYNDRSVLENHHAAAAWSLLLSKPECNFLVHLDQAEFKRFRFLVIEAILATDLKRHFEILAEFNAKANAMDAPGLDWRNETDRLLAMEMCIKLADINGPCKKQDLHIQWTHRIAEEFYEQGDEEASLGLPVSPFMDRKNPQLAKLQESFISHLVGPLCNSYGSAGLLPGQWVEMTDSDSDGASEDKVDDAACKEGEVEESDNETTPCEKDPPRKITSIPATHLRENHDHWLAFIKEEDQKVFQSQLASRKQTCSDDPDITEEEMETIHEEDISTDSRIIKTGKLFRDEGNSRL